MGKARQVSRRFRSAFHDGRTPEKWMFVTVVGCRRCPLLRLRPFDAPPRGVALCHAALPAEIGPPAKLEVFREGFPPSENAGGYGLTISSDSASPDELVGGNAKLAVF